MIQLFGYAAIALAGFGSAWLYQGNRYEAILSNQASEYATAYAEATKRAYERTNELQRSKDLAAQKAAAKLSEVRRINAGNASALISLSDAANEALLRASDSHNVCIQEASTFRDVFSDCTAKYTDMARNADEWFVETQELKESWPK